MRGWDLSLSFAAQRYFFSLKTVRILQPVRCCVQRAPRYQSSTEAQVLLAVPRVPSLPAKQPGEARRSVDRQAEASSRPVGPGLGLSLRKSSAEQSAPGRQLPPLPRPPARSPLLAGCQRLAALLGASCSSGSASQSGLLACFELAGCALLFLRQLPRSWLLCKTLLWLAAGAAVCAAGRQPPPRRGSAALCFLAPAQARAARGRAGLRPGRGDTWAEWGAEPGGVTAWPLRRGVMSLLC